MDNTIKGIGGSQINQVYESIKEETSNDKVTGLNFNEGNSYEEVSEKNAGPGLYKISCPNGTYVEVVCAFTAESWGCNPDAFVNCWTPPLF